MTVLLADDDPDQILVRSMLFRQQGLAVLTADSYSSAMAAASAGDVDCCVLDLRLPTEAEGLRLIRDLKGAWPSVRLFLLTGYSTPSSLPEMQLVDGVFQKGTALKQLLAQLKAFQQPVSHEV